MKIMKISAVVPTKNRPKDLLRSIRSILVQKMVPDELLIIDQSDDLSSKIEVKKLFDDYHGRPPILIYVYDPKIPGLVAAKAEAVNRSSGDLIMFLEDDVELEVDYIQNLAQGFIDNAQMMGGSGVITEVNGISTFYKLMFHIFHRGIFYDKRVNIHGNLANVNSTFIESNYISGGVSAYRRVVFEQVSFDLKNNFFMLEDIDFSTRAVRAFGKNNFYINTSARLAHFMSPLNRARLGLRYRRKIREVISFYKKNNSESKALPSLVWLLFGMFLESVFISIKSKHLGPVTGFWKGIYDGVKWKIIS